jgi:hypothetical protein
MRIFDSICVGLECVHDILTGSSTIVVSINYTVPQTTYETVIKRSVVMLRYLTSKTIGPCLGAFEGECHVSGVIFMKPFRPTFTDKNLIWSNLGL